MSKTDTKILSVPSTTPALPLTTHFWSPQKQFFVFTTLSQTTFMRHVYEPRAMLVEGESSGQLNYFLPSFPAQPGRLVSCSHSLCPSRDITDTVILTPSAIHSLFFTLGCHRPAAPWPSAQLAGEMIHVMTPQSYAQWLLLLNLTHVLTDATHTTSLASSLPGQTLVPLS